MSRIYLPNDEIDQYRHWNSSQLKFDDQEISNDHTEEQQPTTVNQDKSYDCLEKDLLMLQENEAEYIEFVKKQENLEKTIYTPFLLDSNPSSVTNVQKVTLSFTTLPQRIHRLTSYSSMYLTSNSITNTLSSSFDSVKNKMDSILDSWYPKTKHGDIQQTVDQSKTETTAYSQAML